VIAGIMILIDVFKVLLILPVISTNVFTIVVISLEMMNKKLNAGKLPKNKEALLFCRAS